LSSHYAIGIDLGGTKFAVGVVDRDGKLLVKNSRPTGPERSFEEIVKDIAETVKLSLEQSRLSIEESAGTGFGVPSTLDPKTKKLIFANNLYWLDKDLASEYSSFIPGPVYIENDADCAALGESAVDPSTCKNTLMITLGTGFGGGLILDGNIFRGCDGYGIEPGHAVLVYGGRECNCGNRGCVEAYVSATALAERCREVMVVCPGTKMWESCVNSRGERDLNLVEGDTAFLAAKKGDPAALELVEEFTGMAGQAIANLITLFRPEKVIIGGGLSNGGDSFIEALFEAAKKGIFGGGIMPMPSFSKALLGNDAGIVGAAMLAFRNIP